MNANHRRFLRHRRPLLPCRALSAAHFLAFAAFWLVATNVLADPVTLSGITHEYRFDDGGGTTAADSAGAIPATLQNFGPGNAQWISGVFGGAINFNNPNAYVITNAPIQSNLFSVAFWSRSNVKPNAFASALLTPQGDNWIGYDQGHGIGIRSIYDTVQPLQGIWEHYVVTVDRVGGSASVYRDGALRASGAVSLPALNTPWVFGHNQDPGNTNGSFNGALDEVQFYDRILTAGEAAILAASPPQPGIVAHLAAPAQSFGLRPTGEYATATTSFFVDPATTDWLAWNRYPDLRAVSDTLPGQRLLGTYTPEVDDRFVLKVTNPLGQSFAATMDQNGALGAPFGQQSVIFGTAAAAPDVVRGDNFGTPSFFDEFGVFNSIFTVAGNYTFEFSFQNIGGDAGYPNIYLLAHTVPEPGALGLLALGTCCLGVVGRRRRKAVESERVRGGPPTEK